MPRRIAALIARCLCAFAAAAGAAEGAGDACVHAAARRFGLPASLIQAVMDVEGGHAGAVSHNINGSFDIGPMQINSIWLPEIERRGGSLQLVLRQRCANIHFGAWLLSRELAGADASRIGRAAFWRAVGNYHSRTSELNRTYGRKVWAAWRRRLDP